MGLAGRPSMGAAIVRPGGKRRVLMGLQAASLRCVSNVVFSTVISAFPGVWTPRSLRVAREQLPQLRSRPLPLLLAARAPGRRGHRAQLARRLMAPAGRCRWTAGRREQGGRPLCHRTEAAPPHHPTLSPRLPLFPAARCVPYVRPRTSPRLPASQTSTPAPSVTTRSATSAGSTPTLTSPR